MAVVMIHSGENVSNVAWVFIRPFINFAVAVFVALSGYLTDYEKYDIQDCMKRTYKVLMPYFFWSNLFILKDGCDGVGDYVYKLLTGYGYLYFIIAYIQLNFLALLLKKIRISLEHLFQLGVFISCGWVLFSYMRTIYIPDLVFAGVLADLLRFPYWMIYLYMGNKAREKNCWNMGGFYVFMGLVSGIILQIIEGRLWLKNQYIAMSSTQGKLSVMITNAFILILVFYYLNGKLSVKETYIKSLVKKTGDVSFGIYFVHMFMISVLRHSIFKVIPAVYPFDALLVVMISYLTVIFCCKKLPKKICLIIFGVYV